MKSNKIKKTILEMTLYAVVIVTSGSAIIKLTAYRPVRVTATGNTALAMLQVPVAIEPAMEGRTVSYTVNCTMKHGVLSCQP
jgi:hypothetical protein